jgi:ubiquinone/menaquinone biosynthesis C-methylase UbiE
VSIFRWTAPLFQYFGRRRSEDDFEALADWLRPFVATGGVFADLGGGTGDLGAGVARSLGARVVIVDSVPQMLFRVPAHPLVSVQLAGAEALPFPDASFDAVLCCNAFHHFKDQETIAREMARVVRPGGGVLILDMEGTGRDRLWALLERIMGEPAGFRTATELESLLSAHGIVGTSTRLHGSGYAFVGSVSPSP